MSRDLAELALEVDAVIRSIPGVVTLFSVDPALLRTARELTSGAQDLALSQVLAGDDGLSIVASVGVAGDTQAPATARTISDAIRGSLGADDRATASIHVRVSRVA